MVRKTIGRNPLDAVIPPQPAEPVEEKAAPRGKRLRLTLHVSEEVSERLRAAAYWTPGETMTSVAERGILGEVARMEKKRGEPFSQPGKLRSGRPPVF